jgi:hypothetical protein
MAAARVRTRRSRAPGRARVRGWRVRGRVGVGRGRRALRPSRALIGLPRGAGRVRGESRRRSRTGRRRVRGGPASRDGRIAAVPATSADSWRVAAVRAKELQDRHGRPKSRCPNRTAGVTAVPAYPGPRASTNAGLWRRVGDEPAPRHERDQRRFRLGRCRNRRPGVARSHECRARTIGSRRADPETHKIQEQV